VTEDLERELISFVYEQYLGKKWKGYDVPTDFFRSVVSNAREISDLFTLERKQFQTGYLRSKEGRSAYLLYFHLANVVRMLAVLEEMAKRDLWPKRPLRVLDIGAGFAPSLWAVAMATAKWGGEIEFVEAWDQEKAVLRDARDLWERVVRAKNSKLPPLQIRQVDIWNRNSVQFERPFDLIVCSNVLNELGNLQPALTLAQTIQNKGLKADGKWIILEPALLKVSRSLTQLRDMILQNSSLSVPIPCGHHGACPLNNEPKDWCHFEVLWEPPPLRRQLEKAMQHRPGALKYSFLVLGNKDAANQTTYRVLSDPLTDRAGDLILLCVPEKKVALHYDRKEERFGKTLNRLRRGDLLQIDSFESLEEKPSSHRHSRALFINDRTCVKKLS
jgi:ribosomal protein RSM22 (predicted rRNA methylase)